MVLCFWGQSPKGSICRHVSCRTRRSPHAGGFMEEENMHGKGQRGFCIASSSTIFKEFVQQCYLLPSSLLSWLNSCLNIWTCPFEYVNVTSLIICMVYLTILPFLYYLAKVRWNLPVCSVTCYVGRPDIQIWKLFGHGHTFSCLEYITCTGSLVTWFPTSHYVWQKIFTLTNDV